MLVPLVCNHDGGAGGVSIYSGTVSGDPFLFDGHFSGAATRLLPDLNRSPFRLDGLAFCSLPAFLSQEPLLLVSRFGPSGFRGLP